MIGIGCLGCIFSLFFLKQMFLFYLLKSILVNERWIFILYDFFKLIKEKTKFFFTDTHIKVKFHFRDKNVKNLVISTPH